MKKYISITLLICLLTLFNCHKGLNSTKKADNFVEPNAKDNKLSISQVLKENSNQPIENQISLYHKLKKEQPDAYNFENEDELTMYGYGLLWDNQVLNALEVFKLIAAEFSNSSNAYDSLGEAYMVNGNMELSLLNYEKSLAMNPDNFNAEDQIERIKFPELKPLTPKEKFNLVFTVQEYKDDLDQLGEKLLEIHPNALKFITRDDFLELIETKKQLLSETTTYSEFTWHCSEIIASINCSHTALGSFFPESSVMDKDLVFPLQTRWVDGKLFIVDVMNNKNQVNLKDEIQTINGVPVTKLVEDIYKHIPSQGYVETTKKHFFNTWSTEIIPYALDFPETYTIQIAGNKAPILLTKAENYIAPYMDKSIKKCQDNLCLTFELASNTAVLSISSFNYYAWNNLHEFESFIDKSFKEINEKGIENLLIDLRFNGGGSAESSIYLLKYLTNKPFTYFTTTEIEPNSNSFKGNTYFIIDGQGKSTTGHFMSLVKDLNLGTIVGEELGSNQLCTAGQTICRLSNTKLLYYVANSESKTLVKGLPDEKGILPDHYVTQGIDDYLNGIDPVKVYTLDLIKTNIN